VLVNVLHGGSPFSEPLGKRAGTITVPAGKRIETNILQLQSGISGGTLPPGPALSRRVTTWRNAMPALLLPIFLVGVPVVLVGGYYVMHLH
jgi:hypothetical protein